MNGAAEPRKRTSVYIAYDEDGTVIYVGITSRGMTRFAEHEDGSGWWWDAARIELKHMGNRGTADLMEEALIEELNPVHNAIRPHPWDDRPNRFLHVPDSTWHAAFRRIYSEVSRGNPVSLMSRLVSGWLEAYADKRLDAMPGGYRLAASTPQPEPAARRELVDDDDRAG